MSQSLRRIFAQTLTACALVLLMLSTSATQTSAQGCTYGWGNIFVTSPATGSTFQTAQTMTVRWYGDVYTIGNYGGTYALQYSSNGGATWTNIATGVSGYATSYNWTIPANATPSNTLTVNGTLACSGQMAGKMFVCVGKVNSDGTKAFKALAVLLISHVLYQVISIK